MKGKKAAGFILYLFGVLLGIANPPVERLACMEVPSGNVCTGINTPLLALELGLVIVGSLFVGFSYDFNNNRQLNGWLGLSSGLGIAVIGGYAGITELLLFGAVLTTIGLLVYKIGRG